MYSTSLAMAALDKKVIFNDRAESSISKSFSPIDERLIYDDLCLEIRLICDKTLNVDVAQPVMFRSKEMEETVKQQVSEISRKLIRNELIQTPNERLGNGETVLHAMIRLIGTDENLPLYIERLLKQKVDPNGFDYNRLTPLMLAAQMGQSNIVRLLASHESTLLDVQDAKGNTALSHAVCSRSRAAVSELLIACKARQRCRMLLLKNSEGQTAEQQARFRGDLNMAALIASETTKFSGAFAETSTPAHTTNTKTHPHGGWVSYRKQLKKGTSMQAPEKETITVEETVRTTQQVHHARGRFLSLIGAFHDNNKEARQSKLQSPTNTTSSEI